MRSHCRARRHRHTARAKAEGSEEKPDLGLGLKAVWYGAEQFGNIIGLTKPRQQERQAPTEQEVRRAKHIGRIWVQSATERKLNSITTTCMQILSRADAIAAIRRDYDTNYFVSGRGEALLHCFLRQLWFLCSTELRYSCTATPCRGHGGVRGRLPLRRPLCRVQRRRPLPEERVQPGRPHVRTAAMHQGHGGPQFLPSLSTPELCHPPPSLPG